MAVKVRLTRFLESKDLRIRLQRTIKMPVAPQQGWVIHGYTRKPAVKLVAETICWNGQEKIIDCILGTGKLEFDPRDMRSYVAEYYGKKWESTEVALNIETLDALLHSRQDELVTIENTNGRYDPK